MIAPAAPLTTPSANIGNQAQASLFVSQALEAMKKAAPLVDPSSPMGQAILSALKSLGRHAGAAPPETQVPSLYGQLQDAQRTAMQRLALQQIASKTAGAAPAAAPSPPLQAGASPGSAPAAPLAA